MHGNRVKAVPARVSRFLPRRRFDSSERCQKNAKQSVRRLMYLIFLSLLTLEFRSMNISSLCRVSQRKASRNCQSSRESFFSFDSVWFRAFCEKVKLLSADCTSLYSTGFNVKFKNHRFVISSNDVSSNV